MANDGVDDGEEQKRSCYLPILLNQLYRLLSILMTPPSQPCPVIQ